MTLLHTVAAFSMVLLAISKVEGDLQTVSEPTCVIEFAEWIEDNLTVSWQLPYDVISNIRNLRPVVTWISQNSYGNCTVTTLTSCMCDYMNDDVMDSDSIFSLNVTILNETENNAKVFQAQWYIDSETCLKPPMVKNMILTAMNSTCVKVQWDPTLSYLDEGTYKILYRQTGGNLKWMVINTASDWPNFTTVHEVCGLHPYTKYDVMVQHQFYNSENQPTGHWSNSTVSTACTDEDVPMGSPGMFEGGYMMINQNCAQRNTRMVRIYWKAVEKNLRNGEITSYRMKSIIRGTEVTETFIIRQTKNYHYDVLLHCDVDYNITVKASTRVGPSAYFSTVHINSFTDTNDIYSPEEIIPEIDVDHPSINITLLNGRLDTKNQYIVWCKAIRKKDCEGSINWRPIGSPFEHLTLNASMLSIHLQELKVGISTASSGITWASCLYLKTTEIPPPSNLRAFPSSVKNSIEVVWDSQQCSTRGIHPFTVRVEIHICPTSSFGHPNCTGPLLGYTVIDGKHSLVIGDLNKDVVYMIQAVSIGLRGTYSTKSRPIYGQPSSTGSFIRSPGFILLIVGSFAFLLSLLFLITLLMRKVQGHYKRICQIEIPPIALQDLEVTRVIEHR